jgi:hypothetical protein
MAGVLKPSGKPKIKSLPGCSGITKPMHSTRNYLSPAEYNKTASRQRRRSPHEVGGDRSRLWNDHYYEDGPLRDTHSESKVNMWQLHVNAPPQAKKKL